MRGVILVYGAFLVSGGAYEWRMLRTILLRFQSFLVHRSERNSP
jgi:hypothetical protein